MIEIKNNNKLINVFNNINEYDTFLNDPANKKNGRYEESKSASPSFTGTRNYQEASDLLKYGDTDTLKKILSKQRSLRIDKILGKYVKKNKTYNDIVGYQVNVPLYLNGVPTNMINLKKKETNLKIVNIYLNMCASAFVSKDELLEAGAMYAAMIDLLEKNDYRINLYVGNVSQCGGEIIMPCIKVKTDREPLNLKKMSYCIANPSMLRRTGFKYIEVCNSDIDFTCRSYGSPFTDDIEIEKMLNYYLKKDFLVFSYQEIGFEFNIEKLLERLKDRGIILKEEK